jgi:energy-coupling factor transporter transmembrane protein EcfT
MMRLDPRTHIIILGLASIYTLMLKDIFQLHMLVLLSGLYVLYNHQFSQAAYWVLTYLTFIVMLTVMPASWNSFHIMLFTFVKMMPLTMIGVMILRSSPSRLMCVMERVRIPKNISVMFCILIRVFPVLIMEIKSIRDGIRARGIFPQWYSALRHPARVYECFFVPLIVRCLKLSSELASSAEIRGIACSCNRTSIHETDLKPIDGIVTGLYVLIGATVHRIGEYYL